MSSWVAEGLASGADGHRDAVSSGARSLSQFGTDDDDHEESSLKTHREATRRMNENHLVSEVSTEEAEELLADRAVAPISFQFFVLSLQFFVLYPFPF